MEEFYKISTFAQMIGKHVNTVDGWFKRLEEERIHYVNRAGGEKVYDELDLQIGLFINQKRKENWALEAIFRALPEGFELRPFPIDENTSGTQVIDMESLNRHMKQQVEDMVNELAAARVAKEISKRLPDPVQQRQQRVNDFMTKQKVESKLEQEALAMWTQKPVEERIKRVGWFRKEEDRDKREDFIRQYKNEHYEEQLKKEFGIGDGEKT